MPSDAALVEMHPASLPCRSKPDLLRRSALACIEPWRKKKRYDLHQVSGLRRGWNQKNGTPRSCQVCGLTIGRSLPIRSCKPAKPTPQGSPRKLAAEPPDRLAFGPFGNVRALCTCSRKSVEDASVTAGGRGKPPPAQIHTETVDIRLDHSIDRT